MPDLMPSTRARQLAAAKALVEMLEVDDLPEASWQMSAHEPGHLDAIVRSDKDDENRRDDVCFWADFLEIEVVEKPGSNANGTYTDVIAIGAYMDSPVTVKVWTRVDRKEASK
jgi:hypothetical protein